MVVYYYSIYLYLSRYIETSSSSSVEKTYRKQNNKKSREKSYGCASVYYSRCGHSHDKILRSIFIPLHIFISWGFFTLFYISICIHFLFVLTTIYIHRHAEEIKSSDARFKYIYTDESFLWWWWLGFTISYMRCDAKGRKVSNGDKSFD